VTATVSTPSASARIAMIWSPSTVAPGDGARRHDDVRGVDVRAVELCVDLDAEDRKPEDRKPEDRKQEND